MKNKQLIKDILIYAGSGLLGLLIVLILLLSAFPEVSLQTLGFRAYIVKYDTMEPRLNPYDLVFVSKVDVDDLEEDDLITFYADIDYNGEQELVTYYILDITEGSQTNVYRVHGEGTQTPATAVLVDNDILAGYSFKVAKLGYVIDFIASPFGIGVIVVNVGIIAAIVILYKSSKKEEVKEQEEDK